MQNGIATICGVRYVYFGSDLIWIGSISIDLSGVYVAANDRVSSVSGYMCCASLFSGILFFRYE